MDVIHKVGRRKTSVARVYLSKGKGKITINDGMAKDDLSEQKKVFLKHS